MMATRTGKFWHLPLIAAAALISPALSRAEEAPRATVVVTPNPVVEGESVQLRIEVEAGQSVVVFQPTFKAPDFLLVGSQPNYGGVSIRQYVNGQLTARQKTFYEYVLSPKKTGNLMIRDIQVKVGDNLLRSNDTMVKVLPDTGVRPPRPPARQAPNFPGFPGFPNVPGFPGMPPLFDDEEEDQNPASPGYQGGQSAPGKNFAAPENEPEKLNSDFTVYASFSKKKAYVGEPIVVDYWLYDFGGLRQVEVQKWPSFSGFWKEDLEITSRFDFDDVYVEGRPGRRAFISRYALYAIRPGKITPDRLIIRGQYITGVNTRGFLPSPLLRTGTHGSQEATLEILPLPTEGKPDKFSGAVGQFTLKAEADKKVLPQHTPVTFTITLQGTGNFQAIDNMRLPLPPDFEIYESKTGARDSTPIGLRRELSSQKTFVVTAVPRKAGKFTIEAMNWNYFDPESATYKSLSTTPIELEVTENSAGAQGSNTYLSPSGAPSNPPAPEVIQPVKTKETPSFPLRTALNWILLVAGALTAWLVFRLVRARAEKYMGGIFQDRFATAREEYARAKSARDGSWLTHLEDSLYSVGEVLLGANPRGLTRADFEAQWREKRLPASLFNRIGLVLDRLDLNRFSTTKTMDGTQRQKLLVEVETILREAAKVGK